MIFLLIFADSESELFVESTDIDSQDKIPVTLNITLPRLSCAGKCIMLLLSCR
jgi:hypothetical protein